MDTATRVGSPFEWSGSRRNRPIPLTQDFTADLWKLLTCLIAQAREAHGLEPDMAYQEYLDLLSTITAAELVHCLMDEDEERQRSTIYGWLHTFTRVRMYEQDRTKVQKV